MTEQEFDNIEWQPIAISLAVGNAKQVIAQKETQKPR